MRQYFEKYNIFYQLFTDELHDPVPWLGLLCTGGKQYLGPALTEIINKKSSLVIEFYLYLGE